MPASPSPHPQDERIHRLQRLSSDVACLRADLLRVQEELNELQATEQTGPLTAEQQQQQRRVRLESERLRLGLEALRREFAALQEERRGPRRGR